ncbi:MAG: Dabb family protein [Clostridia bacterium]
MLHHIVMWKIKQTADGKSKEQNIDLLLSRYEELKKYIPSIKNAKMYRNIADGDMNDVVLLTEFKDADELNTYINHPKHKEYSEFCKSVRETRSAVDYED